jgi:hypothetical protein
MTNSFEGLAFAISAKTLAAVSGRLKIIKATGISIDLEYVHNAIH